MPQECGTVQGGCVAHCAGQRAGWRPWRRWGGEVV